MKLFLKKILLPFFCFALSFSQACSNNNNEDDYEDEKKKSEESEDIRLMTTIPEKNAVINLSTESVSFVFNKNISIADHAKITLNGAVVEASTVGSALNIKPNRLDYDTDYTAIIEIGALKDENNRLSRYAFSLSFRTEKDNTPKPEPVAITSVSQNGFLSVKGTSLVNEKGQPVILHGVSFGWHNWWPRFYNENTVTWLKNDWKCGVIRAAIGIEPAGAYIDNPATALNCLYAAVDAAIKNDMYVIIDWHSHNIRLHEAKAFFQSVAGKYKDYPNIIYEIFNEPENIEWSNVKAYSEEIIKTIREIDSKNIILVGSPQWDQAVDKPAADPIKGYDNLMYSLHFYAATHKQWLRDRATDALKKGLPLFVSECAGMEASGDGAINKQEWQAWVQWMNDNQISWIAWSVSDKNETCSMIKNTSSPVSGWTDNELKEWGKIVREELRKYDEQ